MLVGMPKENQSQSGHPQPAVDSTEGRRNERKCINYLRKSGCKSLAKNYSSVLSEGTNDKYRDGRKTASKEGLYGRKTPIREPCWTNYWTPPSSNELLGKSMLLQFGQWRGRNPILCENNLHLPPLKITVGDFSIWFHSTFFFFLNFLFCIGFLQDLTCRVWDFYDFGICALSLPVIPDGGFIWYVQLQDCFGTPLETEEWIPVKTTSQS